MDGKSYIPSPIIHLAKMCVGRQVASPATGREIDFAELVEAYPVGISEALASPDFIQSARRFVFACPKDELVSSGMNICDLHYLEVLSKIAIDLGDDPLPIEKTEPPLPDQQLLTDRNKLWFTFLAAYKKWLKATCPFKAKAILSSVE